MGKLTKSISITLFIEFFFLNSYGQSIHYAFSKEACLIYKNVIVTSSLPFKVFLISSSASSSQIKKFDFKNPRHYLLNPSRYNSFEDSKWKNFLDAVDTSQIVSYAINCRGHVHGKRIKTLKINHHFPSRYRPPEFSGLYAASPVIFSQDYQRAFCIIQYNSTNNSWREAFFLEKKDKGWEVELSIMLYQS